jgi:hypothetical protein
MNNKRHKNITVLLGVILLASLFVNIIQMVIHKQKSLIYMFSFTTDMGLPWLPFIFIAISALSALGAIGLMKYKTWGFYGIYLASLGALSIAWFPFLPSFMLQSITLGIFKSIILLIMLCALLGLLIYLHATGKRRLYFK